MSGTGGGGSAHTVPPEEVDCMNLFERTTLNSPDPKVIAQLRLRDVLMLRSRGPRGPLLVVTGDNKIAGSITSLKMIQFIECIQNGFSFVAIVVTIRGGLCEVELRPESKK